MLNRYFAKNTGFLYENLTHKSNHNNSKNTYLEKNLDTNSQFLPHRPLSGGLNDLKNLHHQKCIYWFSTLKM